MCREAYCTPTNVAVTNGTLVLTSDNNHLHGYNFSSGAVFTAGQKVGLSLSADPKPPPPCSRIIAHAHDLVALVNRQWKGSRTAWKRMSVDGNWAVHKHFTIRPTPCCRCQQRWSYDPAFRMCVSSKLPGGGGKGAGQGIWPGTLTRRTRTLARLLY